MFKYSNTSKMEGFTNAAKSSIIQFFFQNEHGGY